MNSFLQIKDLNLYYGDAQALVRKSAVPSHEAASDLQLERLRVAQPTDVGGVLSEEAEGVEWVPEKVFGDPRCQAPVPDGPRAAQARVVDTEDHAGWRTPRIA